MPSFLVRSLLLPVCLLATAAPSGAQLVPVRTVPVASGDQGLVLPSTTTGMAGVRLAVDDTLGDPWTHPARGARLRETELVVSPTVYGISDGGGGARTLPLAAVFAGDRWFGGISLALQQVDNDRGRGGDVVFIDPFPGWRPAERLSDRSLRNLYLDAYVGARLGDGPWALGVGASVADLEAMDGVDLLYTAAERIDQEGTLKDVRLELLRDGRKERLSFLLVHDRVDVVHDVTFVDVAWPTNPGPDDWAPTFQRRVEVNEDRTRTWGGQVAWDRDLAAPGWSLGLSGTVNRKSHPKIPNYEIQNIPRDPGTTWAWDLGVGVARTRGGTTVAFDLHARPIASETWQETDTTLVRADGSRLDPGDRTIENDFTFFDVVARAGLEHRWRSVGVQAGVEVRSHDYELEQRDLVLETRREQDEGWMEWTPTLGVAGRLGDVELRYAGRLTTGTGQPGVDLGARGDALAQAGGDFIVAPRGPLTLQDARILTHRLTVRIPVR